MSGIVTWFGALRTQTVKRTITEKKCFLPCHFVFLTPIVRIEEDWCLQLDLHVIECISDLKQDSEVSDMLTYSLAVTLWINFLYLWKVGIKLTLALAFIIYKLHSQIHGISTPQHSLPFQLSCVTLAGMANQSWQMSTLRRKNNPQIFILLRTIKFK